MKLRFSTRVQLVIFAILFLQILSADANISVDVQPGSATASVGETVVFGAVVVTTGGETITGYQWFMSANSQGPFTAVGQSAALVWYNVQVTTMGYYFAK